MKVTYLEERPIGIMMSVEEYFFFKKEHSKFAYFVVGRYFAFGYRFGHKAPMYVELESPDPMKGQQYNTSK